LTSENLKDKCGWLKDQAHDGKNSFMTGISSASTTVGGQTHTISDPPLQRVDQLTVFSVSLGLIAKHFFLKYEASF